LALSVVEVPNHALKGMVTSAGFSINPEHTPGFSLREVEGLIEKSGKPGFIQGKHMRISYDWLKDYVDISIPVEELAHILTMAGLSVDSIEKKGSDSIMEVEITSNRPDWLSYIGIAREIAAITGKKLKKPVVKNIQTPYTENRIPIKNEDKDLCPRYTARIIKNVSIGESPAWLKNKIESIGLRSVNNVVDITNFCLFETGEPMHAFDLDNLSGKIVTVRRAKKGEKITIIDGTERALDESMLVIADSGAPVAIAGVMGGIKAEVGSHTKNILLEAAYFDPISIRRTSRSMALSTESSYRFERRVDIDNIKYASDRAAQLILELAGGETHDYIDIGKDRATKKIINLKFGKINRVLGINIAPSKIKAILKSLGLKQKTSSTSALKLEIPEFRQDLQSEIDLVEEVARIYGYDNIPETLPSVVEKTDRIPLSLKVDNKIREFLKGLGLSEIISYSLLSRKALSQAMIDDKKAIAVINPLSAEQEILRPSAIAGMLNTMRYNINRKNGNLKFFELGKVYFKAGANSFNEKRNLAIGFTGEIYDGWVDKPRPATLFDLKGILEAFFSSFGIDKFSTREATSKTFSSAACASIKVDGQPLGLIGQIDEAVLKNFDIKDKVYMLEIDCEALSGLASLGKRFKTIARYPSVLRDISIVIDKNVSNADIISSIRKNAGRLLKEVQLIDKYCGGQIPDGKTSLTYRLEYQNQDKTLEDKEVQETHSRLLNALQKNLGVALR